ncbi:MAG TPA: CRISPR system precrRNA processing endoribonuclease RAMP protein Cas6 [Bryobacteraceae bacterium]|nr:CRISPR system precrRNA processing endoribonuclease RAMP protein Cas6 [Bryobacteraceae bacterium]
MRDFSFRRVRFHFRALEEVRFGATAANMVRGALGLALHETAPAAVYERLFKPRTATGPSGLADLPRPFVLRCPALDGLKVAAGGDFTIDIHLFDSTDMTAETFQSAMAAWEQIGIGPRRARVRLERAESEVCTLSLEADESAAGRVTVQFVTPTELKAGGEVVERPEFAVLFARIRDRVATLRATYGAGALDVDFAELGERAAAVRMERCEVTWERRERKAGVAGRSHSLGGFTGHAEYAGELGEFLPWLRAAQWTGVGRQTVWGKGEVRVIS